MAHIYCPHCNRPLDPECARPVVLPDAFSEQGRAAVGWRCFKVVKWPDGKLVLEGRFKGGWAEQKQRARCKQANPALLRQHFGLPEPSEVEVTRYGLCRQHILAGHCFCGIYAYFDGQLRRNFDEVIVQVLGWGATAIHERGFRSEYAKILAGWIPTDVSVYSLDFQHHPRRSARRQLESVMHTNSEPLTVEMMQEAWPGVTWQEGVPDGADR